MTDTPNTPAQESLLTFPCCFPMKVMGLPNGDLENFVQDVLKQHLQEPETIELKSRESSHQKYISVTATFTATSKKELDHIYRIITDNPAVKFVL